MVYSAVIFDMDGTLLDTLEDITDSVNYVIGKYHYPPKSIDEIRAYVGNGAARLIEQCLPQKIDATRQQQILRQYMEYYRENCLIKTKPYPHIIEVLNKLQISGMKLGIVSNKTDSTVAELKKLFFDEHISIAMGESPARQRKPAPDMILAVLDLLNIKPNDAVYVGDSEVDILTARNAGIPCISVTWGFRDAGILRAAGAEYIINTPLELLNFIR